MKQLIVRNVEDAVVDALKKQAAAHGHSAEAEHRQILKDALLPEPRVSLKSHLLAMPTGGDDADFEVERLPARRVEL